MSDLPDRFPRGWFVLGHQRDFPIGETKIIFGFNNKILISKDQSRTIGLLEKNGQFSSTELNKIISKNKSYAKSHLTHLRQIFIEKLNQNYHKLTGFSEPLISSTKNPADTRQIIYFAGNKIFKKQSLFEYIFKK